jgi:hypothetical protein
MGVRGCVASASATTAAAASCSRGLVVQLSRLGYVSCVASLDVLDVFVLGFLLVKMVLVLSKKCDEIRPGTEIRAVIGRDGRVPLLDGTKELLGGCVYRG